MVTDKEYECRLVNVFELCKEVVQALVCVLYPLQIVAEFIVRIFALIVRLVVLHGRCVQINRLVRGIDLLKYLIENC